MDSKGGKLVKQFNGVTANIDDGKYKEIDRDLICRELKLLSRCNSVLIRTESEQELLAEICHLAVETGGYRMAWIGFVEDDAAKSIRIAAQSGYEEGFLDSLNVTWADTERGQGPTGTAIRSGISAVMQDIQADSKMASWRDGAIRHGYRSAISLPLFVNKRVLGTLTIYSSESYAFGSEEVELLEDLAENLSYGIQTLRTRVEYEAVQAVLKRNYEKKLALLGNASDGIHILDFNGNIIEASDSFCAMLGYQRDEMLGMNVAQWDAQWTGIELIQRFRQQFVNQVRSQFETRHRRKDGTIVDVEVSALPLELDGKPVLFNSSRDITTRKSKDAEIERLNRAYRLLSRINELIIRVHDRNALFKEMCDAAVDSGLFRFVCIGILNQERLAVTPASYAGIEDGYTGRLMIRLDDETAANGPTVRAIRTETPVYSQDIHSDPCMTSWRDDAIKRGYKASGVFPIREAGAVVGAINVYACEPNFFSADIVELMLKIAADVSFALDVFAEKGRRESAEDEIRQLNAELEYRVRQRTHQLETVNRELEAFSYSVSHDLRSPLRSIDGFSQILSKKYHDKLDATGNDYLERVRRASQRMGNLIDDMLLLSQVTRGPLKREPVDLSKIAEKVADELSKMNTERSVQFVLQRGLIAYADAGLLRIVMDNLLGNAYKYTGKKASAKIEFDMHDIDGEQVFIVRDNGVGFNMDYAHKLFGAFQRLHGMNEFDGTGIGLATVQRIIHRHHGRVWAEAKEGEGATFYFTLPQREREA